MSLPADECQGIARSLWNDYKTTRDALTDTEDRAKLLSLGVRILEKSAPSIVVRQDVPCSPHVLDSGAPS